ncbi:hypothetical protein BGZ96_008801 [Linnemannia gamsii]|uniref:Uncharacterized protein n=1 Tax=Linnemannia gamsii TaxID=64522 RepID=A0ABQ7JXN4_9FUNG|nr:hypothetical protein BGZ96_008801 [Linnemannia gamsii]
MKLSFALSAVAALAAAVVSAAPVSSNETVHAVDPNGNLQWMRPGMPTAKPIPESQRIGNPKNSTSPLRGSLPCRSITLVWEIQDWSWGRDEDTLHRFFLQVDAGGGYLGKTNLVSTTGDHTNGYFNSIRSLDEKWSVTHHGYYEPIRVSLWANGINHYYYGGNSQWGEWTNDGGKGRHWYAEMEFWDCIPWYN